MFLGIFRKKNVGFPVVSSASIAQRKNPYGAIEEITRKVVGTNVLSRYETKDKQVLRLELVIKMYLYPGNKY